MEPVLFWGRLRVRLLTFEIYGVDSGRIIYLSLASKKLNKRSNKSTLEMSASE